MFEYLINTFFLIQKLLFFTLILMYLYKYMPFYVQFIYFITICNLKLCQLLIKTINDFTTLKSIIIVKTSEVHGFTINIFRKKKLH